MNRVEADAAVAKSTVLLGSQVWRVRLNISTGLNGDLTMPCIPLRIWTRYAWTFTRRRAFQRASESTVASGHCG